MNVLFCVSFLFKSNAGNNSSYKGLSEWSAMVREARHFCDSNASALILFLRKCLKLLECVEGWPKVLLVRAVVNLQMDFWVYNESMLSSESKELSVAFD